MYYKLLYYRLSYYILSLCYCRCPNLITTAWYSGVNCHVAGLSVQCRSVHAADDSDVVEIDKAKTRLTSRSLAVCAIGLGCSTVL